MMLPNSGIRQNEVEQQIRLNGTYLGRTLDVPWTYLGRTLDVPWTYLGRTLDVPWTYLGRTLDVRTISDEIVRYEAKEQSSIRK